MAPDINYLVPLVLIGLVGLGVGALVGFLLSDLRSVSRSNRKKPNRNLIELMTLYHDRKTGQLSVEIGGKFYKKATELKEKTRQGILILIDDLRSWSGESNLDQHISDVSLQPTSNVMEKPAVEIPSESIQTKSEKIPETLETSQASITKEELTILRSITEKELAPSITPPSMDIADVISSAITPEIIKEVPTGSKSIALQVDEILQEKLHTSPLNTHTIRLIELPGKSLIVIVDDTQYDGVSEIPDPEIRQIIRDSVAEWERRISYS